MTSCVARLTRRSSAPGIGFLLNPLLLQQPPRRRLLHSGNLNAWFEITSGFVIGEPGRGGDERVNDNKSRRNAEGEARGGCNTDELGCEGGRERARSFEKKSAQGERQPFGPNVERTPHTFGKGRVGRGPLRASHRDRFRCGIRVKGTQGRIT